MKQNQNNIIDLFDNGRWLLVLAFILQVLSISIDGLIDSSLLESFLFLNLDLPQNASLFIDKTMMVLCLLGLPLIFINKMRFILIFYFFWFLLQPILTFLLHSTFAYQYSILAHAARFSLPLSIYLIFTGDETLSHRGRLVLRVGISLTFIGHGIEAILIHPKFVDYLITFFNNFLSTDLLESDANKILIAIGVIDIIVGMICLFKKIPAIILWMVFWGGITASWRLLYYDYDGLIQFFLRSVHWLGPLFLVYKGSFKIKYLFIKKDKRIFI